MKKAKKVTCSWRSLRSLDALDVVKIRGDFWVVFTIRAAGASNLVIHLRRVEGQHTPLSTQLTLIGMFIQGHGSARILRRNSV